MREAVIVSTARTPIGVAFKGALNNIKSPTMMGHAIEHAVKRAGVDPGHSHYSRRRRAQAGTDGTFYVIGDPSGRYFRLEAT